MKKWLRYIVVLSLVLLFTPVITQASKAEGNCGGAITWHLSDEGVLNLHGSGKMPDFEYELHYNGNYFTAPWQDYFLDIKEVIIEPGITSVGRNAFAGCENLTKIQIPDSVVKLGDYAFMYCDSLEHVKVPDSVKNLGLAFCYCLGITEVRIPDTQTEIPGYAFKGCLNLEKVIVGDQITSIGEDAFYNCPKLDFQIPKKVNKIGSMAFYNCDSLTNAVIPSGVTRIERHCFYGCDQLESVYLPVSVAEIKNDAFDSCKMLKDVFYGGTKVQCDQVVIGADNDHLVNAKIHFLPFEDIFEHEYYYDAVLWAVENGITTGTTDTLFKPEDLCTRAQVVTFLWRSQGKPVAEMKVNPFIDINEDAYYYDAVLWALENNITTGVEKDLFGPDEVCTREQVVTFLWRLDGSTQASADHPFKDISKEEYSYEAILWAVESEITKGTSTELFSPKEDCKRGQIVTFLYRYQ